MKAERTELRLDFDDPGRLNEPALGFLVSTLGERIYRREEFRTVRGYHLCLTLDGNYPPLAIVAMQAILGSDGRRETFNLQRALSLGDAPTFWHSRWNVLYSEKLGRLDTMIDPKEFARGKPALKVEDIGDADVAVLTVSEVEQLQFSEGGEERHRLLVTFEEFPEKGYWCNVTAVKTLVGKLGNNEARWSGKQVPLVRAKTRNPQAIGERGKPAPLIDVLWVAPGDEWDELIATHAGRRRRATKKKTSAKKAARKR